MYDCTYLHNSSNAMMTDSAASKTSSDEDRASNRQFATSNKGVVVCGVLDSLVMILDMPLKSLVSTNRPINEIRPSPEFDPSDLEHSWILKTRHSNFVEKDSLFIL